MSRLADPVVRDDAGEAPPDRRRLRLLGRWHYRRSLASRVTLLTTIAVGLSVAFVALGAFLAVRMQMQASLDESLLERAGAAAAGDDALAALVGTSNLIPSWVLGAADVRIIFLDESGRARTADLGPALELGRPELEVAAGSRDHAVRTVRAERQRFRVVTVPNGDGQALVLAQSLASQDAVLRRLGAVMLLFGGAGVVAAGLAGWGVAFNGLRPVRRLTEAAEDIARTEDLRPLAVEGDDEIARLATAFNAMLTALGASRDRQRQLVADAGHELRTPLTSLRTNLDLLTQADERLPATARAELLRDVRAQIEEMTTLVGDLVELARDERLARLVEPVDLADVVHRAVARVRRRAHGAQLDVAVEPWRMTGEAAALERAVTNLLDNAVKWSPPGGTVRVRLADATLTVDDEGPGIAAEDLPHVFERFYRAEESRSMPGSGLGLSIVRQVAHRHAGTVSAGPSPAGGARLSLFLPGARGSDLSRSPEPPRTRRPGDGGGTATPAGDGTPG